MAAFDFFWFKETNTRTWNDQVSRGAESLRLELPAETDLTEALEAARAAGMPKGSARSACFEIQTDAGIWSHGRRFGRLTQGNATFITWDAMERSEA
jgi:hypothetical protein